MLLKKILHYINLDAEVDDFDKIHTTIKRDIVFKGTNLWILVFAIIVASVGLNMNSTAVIIGAMLISPLMGPINGMGYSIATYNFVLFRRAIKNFTFAVLASLAASTVYFAISPVSTAHSELLARTSPTIYDVLIALFGGFAGIVAISSRFKGNVIPGVAIATALMPPLCTAGYGLATGQFMFFFGAIYLFTINTVFIGIASLVVSQLLKFPIRTLVDEQQKKRVNRWITIVILITVIPSIYFGYGLVTQERFIQNANNFVRNVSIYEGNYLLNKEINARNRQIVLVYGGASLTDEQKEQIKEKAKDFSLDRTELIFRQGFSINEANTGLTEVDNLKTEVNRLNTMLQSKARSADSLQQSRMLGRTLLRELQTVNSAIIGASYSEHFFFADTLTEPIIAPVVFLDLESRIRNNEKEVINNLLKVRLQAENLRVIYYE